MCKSELNACFTKVLDPLNANSPLTHGCLDPIANAADVCSSSSRRSDALVGASAATLECCHEDMCNYRGLQDLAHTRESAGMGKKLNYRDIYVSVKVKNSIFPNNWPRWGWIYDSSSVFSSFPFQKQYVALLFMDIELTNAPPFIFTSPLHTASIRQLIYSSSEPGKSATSSFTWGTWKEITCIPVLLLCVRCVISL